MAGFSQILSNNEYARAGIGATAVSATIRSNRSVNFWVAVSTVALAIVSAQSAAADDVFLTKAPAIPFNGLSGLSGPTYNWNGFYAGGHMGVAWGSVKLDGGSRASAARPTFLRQLIPSMRAAVGSSACKAATITCCQTVFSSAPKSMHHFRAFKPSPASRSAASRILPRRRLVPSAIARRCCLLAPSAAALAMLRAAGCSTQLADLPGLTINSR